MSRITKADSFAKEKHQHLKRKDGITPYYNHLAQVVANLKRLGISDEDMLCAGWLHDTIEDTDTDFDLLEEEFGLEVARMVATVTKDKRLPEPKRESEYIDRLEKAGWKAKVIKLCDIWANLADIRQGYTGSEASRQVENKLRYFDAIKTGLKESNDKIPELEEAISEINRVLGEYGKKVTL